MADLSARRYRQRLRSVLKKAASEARKHADAACEDGENENAVSYEVLDAYANGIEKACAIVCGVPTVAAPVDPKLRSR